MLAKRGAALRAAWLYGSVAHAEVMTNQGPRRTAADGEWSGRLLQAREFHESARSLVTLADSKS